MKSSASRPGQHHPQEPEDIQKRLIARQRLYSFLSMVFFEELSAATLSVLRSGEFRVSLGELDVDFGKEFYEMPEEKLACDLRVEYASLFIVPGGFSPFESAARQGLLGQEATHEVRKAYGDWGFHCPQRPGLFPDHLSLEFGFMAHMLETESNLVEKGGQDRLAECRTAEAIFFTEHLGKWAPEFLREITRRASNPFYREILQLALDFLEFEGNLYRTE